MIHIISTSYDPKPEWRERCIASVRKQTLASTYASVNPQLEHHYINAAVQVEPKTHLENVFNIVHSEAVNPADIIVELDGDDWLLDEFALETVCKEYDRGAWMTYGQFVFWDGKRITADKGWACEYANATHEKAAYRLDTWRATHLKTYRAGLFREIPIAYLLDVHTSGKPLADAFEAGKSWAKNGSMNWFTRATDMATMFPMLEMARERAHFVDQEIYVYNTSNPRSSHNDPSIVEDEKRQCLAVRGLKPLTRRESKPW